MSLSFDNTEVAFKYRTNKELKRAHFLFSSMSSAFLSKMGILSLQWAMKWGLPVKGIIKKTIFSQFCGGENLEEAAATAQKLAQFGVGTALDYGVEGKAGETEFDQAVPEFLKAIEYAASQSNIPFIPLKITAFARFALLEKLHVDAPLNAEEVEEWQRVQRRIHQICQTAHDFQIMILIDAEESWIQQPVDDLANAMMAMFNKERVIVFNTFQLYRHDRLDYLKESLGMAQAHGFLLGAKLVRGAYMEKERARAKAGGYASPIQSSKENTDKDYDAAVRFCLEHLDGLSVFIGTHNENSCLLAARYLEGTDRSLRDRVYFSQLYGMSDNITFNLADSGFKVSKYLPYGPVKDVIPYLLRRAQENSSISGQTGRELGLIKKEMNRRGL